MRLKGKMITQKYLDNGYYIMPREGITLHYFGNGCIADYYLSSVAYLDEIDIKLVCYCNGLYPASIVMQNARSALAVSETEFLRRIESLYTRGVLVFRQHPAKKELRFSGVYGAFYPKEVTIELTNICNYCCPFCYRDASADGEYISTEQINAISELLCKKVRGILLTGGEPTLHPHYQEYIELFSKYTEVHMISNGSVLYLHDPKPLKKLDHIQFSIYGCNDQEYQKMTGSPDGFSRLIKSIDFTKHNMIPAIVAVTLCDETLPHIEQFVKLAIELDMDVIRIGIADSFGRGEYLYSKNSTFKHHTDDALKEILTLKRQYRHQIRIEIPNIAADHVISHNDLCEHVYKDSLRCGCGTEYIVISPKGSIRPCQMLPEVPFSVHSENVLSEHIHGNLHKQQLSNAVHDYCRSIGCCTPDSAPCYALAEYLREENKHAHS